MSSQETQPCDSACPCAGGPGRWRPLRLAAVGIVLAAVVYYAWTRTGRDGAAPQRPADTPPPATMPSDFADPSDLIARPLAGVDLEPLSSPPAEAFAPPGARMIRADRQGPRVRVQYEADGAVEEIEAFYTRRLTEKGYSLRQRNVASGNGVMLSYAGGPWYTISLYPRPENRVKIVLVLTRP